MKRTMSALLATVALGGSGCNRASSSESAGPVASSFDGSGAPSSIAPTASAPAPTAQSVTWRGTYKSATGTLYVPQEAAWKGVRWSATDSTSGVGEGTLTLTVEGGTGRVAGVVDGPLGPAIVNGLALLGKLTAAITRKDPTDKGFTGTLVATVAGDKTTGMLNVSPGEGGSVRSASFSLSPAP